MQHEEVQHQISEELPMFFGVRQGRILGPLLFNLYVVELADRTYSKTIQYTDDTILQDLNAS